MNDSLITKKAIAYSFKEIMMTTPFSKITIQEIMKKVKFRRQTFYDHFADKYELLSWIYEQEVKENVQDYLGYEHWSRVLKRLIIYLYDNQIFLRNAFTSSEQTSFDYFYYEHTHVFIIKLVERMLIEKKNEEAFESFHIFCEYNTHAIVGTSTNWIKGSCRENPEVLFDNIQFQLLKSFEGMLETVKKKRAR